MVFLTPEMLKTLVTGEVNSAQDRQVAIFDKARAKAGGADGPAAGPKFACLRRGWSRLASGGASIARTR